MVSGQVVPASVFVKKSVSRTEGDSLVADVNGSLDFRGIGQGSFLTTLEAQRGRRWLSCGIEIELPKEASGYLLLSVGVRVFGRFGKFDARQGIWQALGVVGRCRNTTRPKSNWQPLCWQIDGRLVESPFYWVDWKAWSKSSSPLVVKQGRLPEELLSHYILDSSYGMMMALKEPAIAAPVELAGDGLESSLTAYMWTPRVKAFLLDLLGSKKVFLRNIGVAFFAVAPGRRVRRFTDEAKVHIATAKEELITSLAPVSSNLTDPCLPESLRTEGIQRLLRSKVRGWGFEQSVAPPPPRGAVRLPQPSFDDNMVKLRVDANYGRAVNQVPIRTGVPLPRGKCRSLSSLALLDAQGNRIPAQFNALAWWPDGSLKWVLVQAFVDVPTGNAPVLTLRYAGTLSTAKPKESIKITKTDRAMIVDTGPLRLTLSNEGSGLFDKVWLEGKEVISPEKERRNLMDLVRTESPDDLIPFSFFAESREDVPSTAKVEGIFIERSGPLAVDICIRGRFHHESLSAGLPRRKNLGCEFWVRMTAYAGKTYLKLQRTYVFEGNPDREFVARLGVGFRPNLKKVATVTIGKENSEWRGEYVRPRECASGERSLLFHLPGRERSGADSRVRASGTGMD